MEGLRFDRAAGMTAAHVLEVPPTVSPFQSGILCPSTSAEPRRTVTRKPCTVRKFAVGFDLRSDWTGDLLVVRFGLSEIDTSSKFHPPICRRIGERPSVLIPARFSGLKSDYGRSKNVTTTVITVACEAR